MPSRLGVPMTEDGMAAETDDGDAPGPEMPSIWGEWGKGNQEARERVGKEEGGGGVTRKWKRTERVCESEQGRGSGSDRDRIRTQEAKAVVG